jgi:hypothetical protein
MVASRPKHGPWTGRVEAIPDGHPLASRQLADWPLYGISLVVYHTIDSQKRAFRRLCLPTPGEGGSPPHHLGTEGRDDGRSDDETLTDLGRTTPVNSSLPLFRVFPAAFAERTRAKVEAGDSADQAHEGRHKDL